MSDKQIGLLMKRLRQAAEIQHARGSHWQPSTAEGDRAMARLTELNGSAATGSARWRAIEAAVRVLPHGERSTMIDELDAFMPGAARQAS